MPTLNTVDPTRDATPSIEVGTIHDPATRDDPDPGPLRDVEGNTVDSGRIETFTDSSKGSGAEETTRGDEGFVAPHART
jgi:hypothetical protein